MNRSWHMEHKMPTAASETDRINWHLEHSRKCRCRPFPTKLLARLSEKERSDLEIVLQEDTRLSP
jgi:hypothetical protein